MSDKANKDKKSAKNSDDRVEDLVEDAVADEEAEDDDVEGHMFGSVLKPRQFDRSIADRVDPQRNVYTLYGGHSPKDFIGEVSRPPHGD